ncbi:polymorphic toxin type 30 domain-containing protein [Pseudonocardia lacus]|uniref:polymorphic toxin type 30 domain-containing protein n=1 Tax=Pseudonocardia lacus TaxID=2835865 RepID=UPI001BDBDD05|nr:polymorphic toxin type 30 domain-containing protein [Pseudonocardia lacus]
MIDPTGIPVIDGDMDALARHADDLVSAGAGIADTGARVHSTWQQLAPVYDAPEVGRLLLSTAPVQRTAASMGEDVSTVGRILAGYASEVRVIQDRLDALRADASAFVAGVTDEPTAEEADRSNAMLSQVNAAVADFDDAQRRCANAINALYGGTTYRADDGDGRLDPGEFGSTAADLDAAARGGALPWGAQEAPPEEDHGLLSTIGHTVLDVVGLVPVIGEVADGANALWYLAEGDELNAALSAAAMVPVAGWVATGGKFAVKGYKAVRTLDDARMFVRGKPPMVPDGATRLPFGNPRYKGERYEWINPADGKKVRWEAHGRDPSRPPTENAGAGPIYREKVGNHYLDAQGGKHTKNSVENPNSSAYREEAANATHIPYPQGLPAPGSHRVVVPNVAALAPDAADLAGPGGDGG